MILEILACISVTVEFCCYAYCKGPTLGTNIMSLASSLAATAGTNIIGTANVFVKYSFIVHIKYRKDATLL